MFEMDTTNRYRDIRFHTIFCETTDNLIWCSRPTRIVFNKI